MFIPTIPQTLGIGDTADVQIDIETTKTSKPTMPVQELADILRDIGGEGRISEIYAEYMQRHPDDPFSKNRQAAIRNKLQRNCRTAKQWQGKHNLFESPARGIWRLLSSSDFNAAIREEVV